VSGSFSVQSNHRMSIKTKCIKVCKLNEYQVCIGCHRTIDEIRAAFKSKRAFIDQISELRDTYVDVESVT